MTRRKSFVPAAAFPFATSRRRRGAPRNAGTKALEVALTAPIVILERTTRMARMGAVPSASDRAEMMRMGVEKVEAATEVATKVAREMARTSQSLGMLAATHWLQLATDPAGFLNKSLGVAKRGETRAT